MCATPRLDRARARYRASNAALRHHASVERARDVHGDPVVPLSRFLVSSPEPRATRRVDARDAAQTAGAAQGWAHRRAGAGRGAPRAAVEDQKLQHYRSHRSRQVHARGHAIDEDEDGEGEGHGEAGFG